MRYLKVGGAVSGRIVSVLVLLFLVLKGKGMTGENVKCPICTMCNLTKIEARGALNQLIDLECPICGKCTITDIALGGLQSGQTTRKLSAWIREQNESQKIPQLISDKVGNILFRIPDYSPSEKQLKLLKNIERKSNYPGESVKINRGEDFPLAWANNPDELVFYLKALRDRGFITLGGTLSEDVAVITAHGWDYLDQYGLDIEEKVQVFVAMSFDGDMSSVWTDGIKPAIEQAGYRPYRIDQEPHSDMIDVKIMAEIKNSRFLIADVTQQNKGVYFEAGYALGLGLPVIWCVKEDDLKNVHFDTRQYNHITYETEDELKEKLYDFVCAIIGKRNEG